MNKKISFPIALIIIVVCAVFTGVIVAWQYGLIPEIGPSGPSPRPSAKEFTIGLDEKAKIIYETEITHEEFLISLKNIDILNKSVEVDLKREYEGFCNFPEAIRFGGRPSNMLIIGESAFCYTTEECGVEFKLIKLQDTKATFETFEDCAPPGPKGPFLPKEIIIEKIEQITITTDKTEYEQGGTLEITVRNGLDKSIFYREWNVKNPCGGTAFSIGKKTDDGYNFYPLGLAECATDNVELESETTNIYELNLSEWVLIDYPHTTIERGIYKWKFTYKIKKEDTESKTIYSNEFTIKK